MRDNEPVPVVPRAQVPGLGLGERLRSARKARALSVAQVAETLRLEEAIVVALEDERFDAVGAPVFVRGHLKRYAQLVGLSPEAMLDAYRAAVPDSDALPSLPRRREQADTVRMGPWVYWLAAGVLVAGIVVALSGGDREEPAAIEAPNAALEPVPVPVPVEVPPAVERAPTPVEALSGSVPGASGPGAPALAVPADTAPPGN